MTEDSLITLGGATWRGEDEATAEASSVEESDESNPDEFQASHPRSEDIVYGPDDEENGLLTEGLSPVNIRNFSVKCASCGNYQVIVGFRQIDEDWNEYTYECDQPPCSSEVERSRTVLEIPSALDEYARRDPTWRGGEIHAGAKYGSDE